MKKLIGILILAILFCSCDDGDIEVQNISFENVEAFNCGDIVYKIKGNEAFLIIIPTSELSYKNEVTTRTKTIGGPIRVIYRNYSGVPSNNNFCFPVPAASPNVLEEWNAIGGKIEIKTTAVRSDPAAVNQATRISKYNHYIVLKDLIFQKPSGTQNYDNYIFGNYQTNTTLQFPSSGSQTFNACNTLASPARIYYNNNAESVLIDNLDSSLFVNLPNTSPIIKNIGTTINVLTIKTYNGVLPTSYYCGLTLPTTPVVQDTWQATGGTIEVTTTTSTGTFTHTIRLKNVTIAKTGSFPESFYLGNDYILGNFVR